MTQTKIEFKRCWMGPISRTTSFKPFIIHRASTSASLLDIKNYTESTNYRRGWEVKSPPVTVSKGLSPWICLQDTWKQIPLGIKLVENYEHYPLRPPKQLEGLPCSPAYINRAENPRRLDFPFSSSVNFTGLGAQNVAAVTNSTVAGRVNPVPVVDALTNSTTYEGTVNVTPTAADTACSFYVTLNTVGAVSKP
jgi:hypothetical protein